MPDRISETLIARARAGNAAAVGELYELCQDDLFRYLYYRVGDQASAEDLTSEVFLRIIKGLPGYRQGEVPFKAWIFRIAHNLTVDHYRKESVRDHIQMDEKLESDQAGPDKLVEHILDSQQLAESLEALTADQREVIIMRFVLDMSIRETSHSVEKSETAVKAAQRRGLQALKRILEERMVING
ncbi:MAG: sigma-70 family RNA polymerase sigma factor [Anaerolineales bacterium]|nr:sigma-70 family RNA polymerase sigma factor [Anaerolineales bacterium]